MRSSADRDEHVDYIPAKSASGLDAQQRASLAATFHLPYDRSIFRSNAANSRMG